MTRRFAQLGLSVLVFVAMLMLAGVQDPPAGAPPNKADKETKEKSGKKESESKAKRLASVAVHVKVVGAGAVIVNETVTATFAGRELSERTNRDGIALFTLADASAGSFQVLLTPPGFETFQKDFQISAADTNIEIHLKRRGGGPDPGKGSTSSNSK